MRTFFKHGPAFGLALLVLAGLAGPAVADRIIPDNVQINGHLRERSYVDLDGISAPGVSASDKARLYFDTGSGKLYVSKAGGAFAELVPGTGAGGVTSVAVSVPSWLTSAGGPITSSGTIAITATSGQTQNRVLASPDGSSGALSVRALVAADIPTISGSQVSGGTLGATNGSNLTSLPAANLTGTLPAISGANLTSLSAGNLTAAGTFPAENGSALTALNGSNISSGTVAIARGGTGAGSASAAFDALSPMNASGDLIYGGASGTGTRLAKGSDTQVLTLASGLPTWASPAAGGVTSITAGTGLTGGTITTSGTVALDTPVTVAHGGSGATSFTAASIIGSDPSSSTGALRPLVIGSGLTLTGSTLTASGGAGGGGSLILLEQHTASTSSTLDFTTAITASYDMYEIEFVEILSSTTAGFDLLVSTDGGSTWDSTSGHYGNSQFAWSNGGTAASGAATTSIRIAPLNGRTLVNTQPISGTFRFWNPLGSTRKKLFMGTTNGGDSVSSDVTQTFNVTGAYLQTTAVNALRFQMSTGTITSGIVRLYGVAH